MSSLLSGMHGMREWMSLFAAIGNLSLAAISAFRRDGARTSPLSRSLAALCFCLFGWNFAVVAQHSVRANGAEPGDAFDVLDALFSALSPPLVFEVVLGFLGEARRRRVPRLGAWAVFGALSLASLGGLFSPAFVRWIDSTSWSLLFLAGWVATFVYEVVLLSRYLTATIDPREKARARIVLVALALGGTFSMSDVVHSAGLPTPYLGAVGTLITAGLLTTLVLRLELFDRNVSARTAVYALGMIAAFVAAYLVVLVALAGRLAVQVFAACLLTLLGAAVARELALSLAETRSRTHRLALLGRFSAQMAHDVKGPLTALLGAMQMLESGEDEVATKEYLGLASEAAKRIATVVDRYDRMARIEPQKTIVRINEVVRHVARGHGLEESRLELAAADPECDADRALVESALENVIRNAVEAASGVASVRVSTAIEGRPRSVVVRVSDDGPGMDARILERAAEDFFSTKPGGSGLGLAFVRRVLEAHGGALVLRSQPGSGTTVELRLPELRG
jgi:signal transduction histidine kinase